MFQCARDVCLWATSRFDSVLACQHRSWTSTRTLGATGWIRQQRLPDCDLFVLFAMFYDHTVTAAAAAVAAATESNWHYTE